MIPASADLLPPSPNANISPPTTIDTSARPRAIGPVNAVDKFATASTRVTCLAPGPPPVR